jgi:hypothetical protein
METPKVLPSLSHRQIDDLSVKIEELSIYTLAAALNNVRGTPDYSLALSSMQAFATAKNVRINIFSADGTCILDTNKSTNDNNNPQVFLHDNGFLRSSVNRAMLASENAIQYEIKYSNTTNETDAYVAVRLGSSPSNVFGAVRLAQKAISLF